MIFLLAFLVDLLGIVCIITKFKMLLLEFEKSIFSSVRQLLIEFNIFI